MNPEDAFLIQQAVARYSHTFDAGDVDGWADVFTEDGIWEFYAAGAVTPSTRLVGRAALREFAEKRYSGRPKGLTSYHHQSGILFDELTADTARTRVMVIITTHAIGEPTGRIYMTGVYTDLWRKTSRGWKMAHRVLRP